MSENDSRDSGSLLFPSKDGFPVRTNGDKGIMGETGTNRASMGIPEIKRNGRHEVFDPSFFVQLPQKLQNGFKSQLKRLANHNETANYPRKEKASSAAFGVDLESQLQAWRENPSWVDQPPQAQVSVPKGALCKLNLAFNVGLPPDAVYNIITNPDNKRVFKNIKEVISRRVLLDEGQRQVMEQATSWKFLWGPGTISVHLLVDQNREDFSMKFKQLKPGLMKRYEGCWRVEPLFVDETICNPFKPETWEDYVSCTCGKGRIGSKVSLEQIILPAIVSPPPISWYLRGITSKSTETIAADLMAEAARIRGDSKVGNTGERSLHDHDKKNDKPSDIKERWAQHKRNAKKHRRRLLAAE